MCFMNLSKQFLLLLFQQSLDNSFFLFAEVIKTTLIFSQSKLLRKNLALKQQTGLKEKTRNYFFYYNKILVYNEI